MTEQFEPTTHAPQGDGPGGGPRSRNSALEGEFDPGFALWKEVDAARASFPGWRDLGRLAKRQAPFVLILVAILASAGAAEILATSDRYVSWVTVTFDPRDGAEGWGTTYPRFEQIADAFRRAGDDENLRAVLLALPEAPEALGHAGGGIFKVVKQRLKDVVGPRRVAETKEEERDREVNELLRDLKEHLSIYADDKTLALSLGVNTVSPEWSQRLTGAVMEDFVQRQLRAEAGRVGLLYDSYRQFLTDARRAEQSQSAAETAEKTLKSPTKSDAAKDAAARDVARLKERESELMYQVQAKRSASTESSGTVQRRRAELEQELAKLRTTLNTSHPDLIAKEDELREFERSLGPAGGRGALRVLQDELADVRAKLGRAGEAPASDERTPTPSGGAGETEYTMSTMSLKAHQLFVDRMSLERQLHNPDARTWLKTTYPPNYDAMPQKAKTTRLLTLFFAALAAACGAGLLREIFNSTPRDAWRIEGYLSVPLIGELPRRLLTKFPGISPQTAGRLRQTDSGKRTIATDTLAAYRKMIYALRAKCRGRRVLFITAGSGRYGADFFYSLLNLYGLEAEGPMLFVDCNHLDPVITPQVGTSAGGDIASLLAGKSTWANTRIAKTPDTAFDLVPPPPELTAENARSFRTVAVQKLLAALEKSYQTVFVRGLKGHHVLENSVLANGVSDIVLIVNAGEGAMKDLRELASELGKDRIRGFILLGT